MEFHHTILLFDTLDTFHNKKRKKTMKSFLAQKVNALYLKNKFYLHRETLLKVIVYAL